MTASTKPNCRHGRRLCVSWSSTDWQPQIVLAKPVAARCATPQEPEQTLVVTNRHSQVAGRSGEEFISIAKTHCYSADPTAGGRHYSN